MRFQVATLGVLSLVSNNLEADRILVISENPQWLAALSVALRDQGYKPFLCTNAEQAQQLASDLQPGVLVVDGHITESLDGGRLARLLHAQDPQLQCVMICDPPCSEPCAEPQEDWIRLCEKPFTMIHFAALLDEATQKK